MKEGWETKEFDACIEKVKVEAKLPSSMYQDSGNYPVVSQEKDLISGYWDKVEDLFTHTTPAVVFGDHTMVVKYVDFDFVVGADGVKVLIPKPFFVPKFFYYWVSSVHIQNRGYARHYRYLRENAVPVPSLSEQQRIVDILNKEFEKIDILKTNAEQTLQYAKDLFQATLTKELEPKDDWKKTPLINICEKITDGTHNSPPNTAKGEYKYITAKNIKPWGLDLNSITYVSSEIHNEIYSRCNPCIGDVLYIKDGATTGIAIINPLAEEFSMLSSVALLKPNKELLKSEFLCYAMNSPQMYKYVRGQMDGAAITRITLNKIKSFEIAFPSLDKQEQIIATLDSLNTKCKVLQDNYTKAIALCDVLKQSLLREAFNGKL